MPIVLDIEDYFKKVNLKPSYDSDGGGDYANGVDTLDAPKFNHRWNRNDELFEILEKNLELFYASLNGSNLFSYYYSRDYVSNDEFDDGHYNNALKVLLPLNNGTAKMKLLGSPAVVFTKGTRKAVMPLTQFIDFIRAGDEQFAISSGSTNLFEIQTDYPTTNKRWYRLGHDGGEITPTAVTVQKTITSPAQYSVTEVIFKDYDNNPSGDQIIEINGANGTYIKFKLTPSYSTYRLDLGLWDGATLQTYGNVDTGVTRSTGEYTLTISCEENLVKIYLNHSLIYTSTSGEYSHYVSTLKFASLETGGGADYFDILRYNLYESLFYTFTVEQGFYFVFIDINDNKVKITDSLPTDEVKLIAVIRGSTSSKAIISDYRFTNFEDTRVFAGISSLAVIVRDEADPNSIGIGPSNITIGQPLCRVSFANSASANVVFYARDMASLKTAIESYYPNYPTRHIIITEDITLNEVIDINSNVIIEGINKDITITCTDNPYYFNIDTKSNVIIKNLLFNLDTPTTTGRYCIYIEDSSEIIIENCNFTCSSSTYGTAIFDFRNSTEYYKNVIKNCNFNGFHDVIISENPIRITQNYIKEYGGYAIIIGKTGTITSEFMITENTIRGITASDGGIYLNRAASSNVSNNYIRSNDNVLYLDTSGGSIIDGNQLTTNGGSNIFSLINSDLCVITSNIISNGTISLDVNSADNIVTSNIYDAISNSGTGNIIVGNKEI